jgi:hypothetical protein
LGPVGIFSRKKRATEDESDAVEVPETAVEEPARGPKDAQDVSGQEGRLDLGALWVRGVPGMELRLEVDEPRQKVIAVQLVLGDSQVQLQAFAAPKTMGIWDEIRDEIAQSVATGGGTAEEVEGPLGAELHARMPSRAQNGRTVFAPARFVGVDGPRWFFRAVMTGRAAVDAAAAAPLYALLDEVVVVRGEVPMAPREVLDLQLPKNVSRSGDQAAAQSEGAEDGEPSGDDADGPGGLEPFERGPEITETR